MAVSPDSLGCCNRWDLACFSGMKGTMRGVGDERLSQTFHAGKPDPKMSAKAQWLSLQGGAMQETWPPIMMSFLISATSQRENLTSSMFGPTSLCLIQSAVAME